MQNSTGTTEGQEEEEGVRKVTAGVPLFDSACGILDVSIKVEHDRGLCDSVWADIETQMGNWGPIKEIKCYLEVIGAEKKELAARLTAKMSAVPACDRHRDRLPMTYQSTSSTQHTF
nr:hypothetical protein HmN_000312900 [Hymenolepis microstoma]